MTLGRRAACAALVLLLAVFAVACDDEPAQRKAFVEFLQTRIVAKPGLHVPRLGEEQTGAFGDYAKHYAIIVDFNAGLDHSVGKPLQEAMKRGAVRSLDDVVARRADIVAVRDGMAQLRAALDEHLAAADSARAALKQPDDLKAVFDQAYERTVTAPAKAFADIFPDLTEALTAIVALADFLDQYKAEVTIRGSLVQTGNPTLQTRLTTLINAVSAKSEANTKAQQRLRGVISGG